MCIRDRCWPDSFRPVMRSRHSRSHTLSCREFGPRKRAVGMFSQTAFGTLAGVRSSSSTAEISHKAESMAGVSGVVARRVRAADDTAICSISGHYHFHLSTVNLSIVPSGVSTHTLWRVHSYPPACPLIPSGASTFTLRRVHFWPTVSVRVSESGTDTDTDTLTDVTRRRKGASCKGRNMHHAASWQPDMGPDKQMKWRQNPNVRPS